MCRWCCKFILVCVHMYLVPCNLLRTVVVLLAFDLEPYPPRPCGRAIPTAGLVLIPPISARSAPLYEVQVFINISVRRIGKIKMNSSVGSCECQMPPQGAAFIESLSTRGVMVRFLTTRTTSLCRCDASMTSAWCPSGTLRGR